MRVAWSCVVAQALSVACAHHAPAPVLANSASGKETCSGDGCRPELVYTDSKGKTFGPSELADKVVVITFCAVWAGTACNRTLLDLDELHAKHPKDAVILALMTEPIDDQAVKTLVDGAALSVPLVYADKDILRAYDFPEAVPMTFVFERSGRRAARRVGVFNHGDLGRLVESLLAPSR